MIVGTYRCSHLSERRASLFTGKIDSKGYKSSLTAKRKKKEFSQKGIENCIQIMEQRFFFLIKVARISGWITLTTICLSFNFIVVQRRTWLNYQMTSLTYLKQNFDKPFYWLKLTLFRKDHLGVPFATIIMPCHRAIPFSKLKAIAFYQILCCL